MTLAHRHSHGPALEALPRIGFVGLGWIGQHRMKAAIDAGALEAIAYVEPSHEMAAKIAQAAPGVQRLDSPEQLADLQLDGVVIATPSAAHAEQSINALETGLAVFCQKPLGRSRAEVERVLSAARRADRLLAVDFSYRFTAAARSIREQIAQGSLGSVYAIDLVFHNAYGPDKPWFYERSLSGGGCVMDLGVHLVDLALWTTGETEIRNIQSQLFAGGVRLGARQGINEDFAFASFDLGGRTAVRLSCSWRLHAGQEAVISAAFFGTDGAVRMRNVGGSFYDFVAERLQGTQRIKLAEPPDAWGGRAIVDWAHRLRIANRYDPTVEDAAIVAAAIDGIYAADG